MPPPEMMDCSHLMCYDEDVLHGFDMIGSNTHAPTPTPTPTTMEEALINGREEEGDPLSFLEDIPPLDLEESISDLMTKEKLHRPKNDYLMKLNTRQLYRKSRQNVVDWLLKVHALYRFGPITACLSVNYVDRFLSQYENLMEWKAWMVGLLSVACLSLAAKMEELEVPLLLDLQEGVDYIFEPRIVQRMELVVLSTLDWRMNSVTPFSYMDALILKLDIEARYRGPLLGRMRHLVLQTLKDIRFVEYLPSSIATSATMCVVQELLPLQFARHHKTLFHKPTIGNNKESCLRCFQLMCELMVAEPLSHPCVGKRVMYYNQHEEGSNPPSPLVVVDSSFSNESQSSNNIEYGDALREGVQFDPIITGFGHFGGGENVRYKIDGQNNCFLKNPQL